MLAEAVPPTDPRAAIRAATYADEAALVRSLAARAGLDAAARGAIVAQRRRAGRGGARAIVADGDGGVPRRVRALHRRGRRAHVPRRGVAAGARCRDDRRPDRRQDRAVELGRASRALDLEPRQRRHLGAPDHREGARRRSGPAGGGAQGDDPAARRAGGAWRGRPGDEADGPAVRPRRVRSAPRWIARAASRRRGTPTRTTCSARRRVPTATRCAMPRPMRGRSRRSPAARPATWRRARGSR